jgi:hypothetical protein
MVDFSVLDKFDSTKGYSQVKFGADSPLLETELNEMQKIMDYLRAEIVRSSVHSGVLEYTSAIATSPTAKTDGQLNASRNDWNNLVYLNPFNAILNGYKLLVSGFSTGGSSATNLINLPAPPTFGTRDDLVFLEAWFEEYDYTKDSVIKDARINAETSRRVKLNWRIRTVAGVDFVNFPEGLARSDVSTAYGTAQGGRTTPLAFTDSYLYRDFYSSAVRAISSSSGKKIALSDIGLYIAGDGTDTAKTTLQTADGYVYAIPLFRVKRRNSGGYRNDNVNGARDYYTLTQTYSTSQISQGQTYQLTLNNTDYANVKVGDYWTISGSPTYLVQVVSIDGSNKVTIINLGTTIYGSLGPVWVLRSDRPDGLYSNIIDANDIIDLRHKVSLTGFNYQQLLEQSFDQLLRGQLTTKDTLQMKKERFGLTPAPLGLQQQLMPVTVVGNDGVNRDLTNLLGSDGSFEGSTNNWGSYSGSSFVLDTASKLYGNTSLKVTIGSASGGIYRSFLGGLDTSKYYLFLAYVSNDNTANVRVALDTKTTSKGTMYGNLITGNGYQLSYLAVQPSDLANPITLQSLNIYATGSSGNTFHVDGLSAYVIDQATYNAITGATTGFATASDIQAKFPYISSYPNVVGNLFDKTKAVVDSYIKTDGTVGSSSGWVASDFISIAPNTVYTANNIASSGAAAYAFYDSSKTLISSNLLNSGGIVTFTSPSNASYVRTSHRLISTASTGQITDAMLSTIQVEAGSISNPVVPFGRWFLPYDYANGDTATRISDYMNTNQRQVWSDAQMTDTVTAVIDPVNTNPQKHITVTQQTAGQWKAGDTIAVKSDDGIISGVIDSDTALAKIVSATGTTSITVDDVSKIAVNDILTLIDTNWNSSSSLTVSAVDTVNKIVTFSYSVSSSFTSGYVVETTASSSSPVTTATGLVGTWGGLGTKAATFTITTAPTTNTDLIKIQYAVSYPSGKGIVQVPYDVLEGKVNGDRLIKASDGILHIKANFAGKISGNTDLIPHFNKSLNSSSLQPPSAFTGESSTTRYGYISALDGGTPSTESVTASGSMIQVLFSFDIIRALTDKLGTAVFDDCVTLADKVAKAKTIASSVTCTWYGYGSSPTGNKATLQHWYPGGSNWATNNTVFHTNASVTKLSNWITPSSDIDANGFVYFLAYADPSDGVTASTINTDYVELELQVNLAETGYDVLIPENNFPRLQDNLLPSYYAFITDPSKFNNQGGVQTAITSDGFLQITNPLAQSGATRINFATENRKAGTWYTLSFDGKAGTESNICFEISNSSFVGGYTSIVLSPTVKRYTFSFQQLTDDTTMYIYPKANQGALGIANGTVYIQNLKLEVGTIPSSQFTQGLKKKKVLNFLGKVAGSTFENPHKFYARNSGGFSDPYTSVYEYDPTAYGNVGKQDGVLTLQPTSTTGQYAQQLFEFDLSHLGMSLAELKSALRNITVNWTGYGVGDNGGVQTPGATLSIWNFVSNGWANNPLSADSTPTAHSWNSNSANYITKDQKVYVLVYSTYPASATNPSNIYTDYINLTVQLADYVDYVKANVVKVRKETKEVKLVYPKKSYRSGIEDTVELFYRYVPYQGVGVNGDTFNLVFSNPFMFLTSLGTGKAVYTSGKFGRGGLYNKPTSPMLPMESIGSDTKLLSDDLTLDGASMRNGYGKPVLKHLAWEIDTYPNNLTPDNLYGVNASLVSNARATRGFGVSGSASMEFVAINIKAISPRIIGWTAIVSKGSELYLLVGINYRDNSITNELFIDYGNSGAVDIYKLSGRPLVKGVN